MTLSIKYFSPDTQLSGDAVTSSNEIRILGIAPPSSAVYIYDGDSLLGSTISDGSGNWSYNANGLSDGAHYFATAIRDASGNLLEGSDHVKITVAPSITGFTAVNDAFFRIDGQKFQVQSGGQPWSITNPDSHTTRFQVSSGDTWVWDAEGRERSEIAGQTLYKAGEVVTIKYDMMVEPGAKNTATGGWDWFTIGQLHQVELDGCPPFSIELIGERLAFNVSYQQAGDKKPSNNNYIYIHNQDIVRGNYYDMKIQSNLQNDKGGFVKIWVDGQLLVDYSGPVGYGSSSYWKHGIYRTATSETMAVNFKNLVIEKGSGDQVATLQGEGDVFIGTANRDVHEGSETTQLGNAGSDELSATLNGNDYEMLGGKGNDDLTGLNGSDTLSGGDGADTLNGSTGNDFLKGGKGKDQFKFFADFGHDTVSKFEANKDKVLFFDTPFERYKDLKPYMSKEGQNTKITIDEDSSLLLKHIKLQKLDSHDFHFG
jgi:Ca2+-binding RTX toxin-like protein